MKYKVGQKVNVRKGLKVYNVYGGLKLIEMMHALCGMTLTIKEITGEGFYRFVETNFTLSDAMIEGLADEPEHARPEPSRLEIAAMAMKGMLACPNRDLRYDSIDKFVSECYEYADALIKECNRTKQEGQK